MSRVLKSIEAPRVGTQRGTNSARPPCPVRKLCWRGYLLSLAVVLAFSELGALGLYAQSQPTPAVSLNNNPSSIWNGLVAYYPFDKDSNDYSGFGNNLQLNGGASIVANGEFGAPIFPPAAVTRWHGTISGSWLRRFACPTARIAPDCRSPPLPRHTSWSRRRGYA